ncbi:MAG: transcriptional regulator TrmB [Parcubacteria group bacterium Gr01-1014_33]|nr:MAG: transcriptional regulator TrmB [Parcubacteria group bacterium Gr01-1014_33]
MIKEKLRELEFSEKEVKVYLALLEIGSAVASDIAKKAKIKRSTTYVVLDSLAERGLISVVERRGVQLYSAAPPEQLVRHLQGMARRYSVFADVAKELIPELKASRIATKTSVPKVHFFEGSEGIKTVYEDTLASLEEIRVHAGFERTGQTESDAGTKRWHGKSDIKIQTIVLDTPGDRKRAAPDKESLRKILLTSREKSGFSSEMNIYDDRVVFISPSENFALIAESKEFAGALRGICDAAEQRTVLNLKMASDGFAPAFG